MRSDEDLDSMAESIKANGLRVPVVLGMAVTAEGFPPQLCVIDGRNRIAACKRAGVMPHTVTLNGEDQDAFIADANLERRDLTKGQKAMLIAIRYPERQQGKKRTSADSAEVSVSYRRIAEARSVYHKCPQYIELVIDGSMGLDAAYKEAHRKDVADAVEADQRETERQEYAERFNALKKDFPDLADDVRDERRTLADAMKEADARREERENRQRSSANAVRSVGGTMAYWAKAGKDALIASWLEAPDYFDTSDLKASVDNWIATLTRIREELS
ncbi:ParB N-terminal domain-containing protein [Paraburkholderia sediminicola]